MHYILLASYYMRNSMSFEVVLERPRGDFNIHGGYGAYHRETTTYFSYEIWEQD